MFQFFCSSLRIFSAAILPVLNISVSFAYSNFGLPLAKSKNLPFHPGVKFALIVYQQAVLLKFSYLWWIFETSDLSNVS